MRLFSRKALALALTATIALPTSVFATNGYFLIGFGAKSRSMGGTGVAYGQDALAAAANPATMTDVKMNAMRIDVGGEFFNPPRSVIHDSDDLNSNPLGITTTDEKSGSNIFLIPSMGGIYKFNRKLTMGMAVVGNGANTRYEQFVPGLPNCVNGNSDGGVTGSYFFNFNCNADSTTIGVNLLQMQMLPSVAYKVTKNHSIGASLAIAVQSFRAYGLGAFSAIGFAGEDTGKTSGNGNDFSYGAGVRIGWLGKFFKKRLSLGANYASRVYMTEFDKYTQLFAEQGDFDIPEHWTIGLAYKLTDKLDIAFDYQQIMYSNIASIGNEGPTGDPANFFPAGCQELADGSNSCELGRDDGMGFGWNDAEVFKVGINYDYNKQWSFRAGYNHGDSVITDDQVLFNMLAPAVTEDHITIGASYRPSQNVEWSFNYMHALENTVRGPTAFSNRPAGDDNAAISMYINSLGVSFSYSM